MMEAKTFEIRDEGTFIPILAVRLQPGDTEKNFEKHSFSLASKIASSFPAQASPVILTFKEHSLCYVHSVEEEEIVIAILTSGGIEHTLTLINTLQITSLPCQLAQS